MITETSSLLDSRDRKNKALIQRQFDGVDLIRTLRIISCKLTKNFRKPAVLQITEMVGFYGAHIIA